MPHCGKNFRSHVLDYGILVPSSDGFKTLDKEDFIDLLRYDKGEIKLCPKLTSLHVNCYGSMRQRVRLATQLLSNTVSKAIIHLDGDDAEFKSQYVSTFDAYFDTMNSNREYADKPLRCGFGKHEEEQIKALEDMKDLVTKMRFCDAPKQETKKPFQKGILISINSTLSLWKECM